MEIRFDKLSSLSDVLLKPRIFYVDDFADYVNDYELDVRTTVKSVSGSGSSAIAEIILAIDAYDGLFTFQDRYEIKFSLQKSSGVWRIRNEHIVYEVHGAIEDAMTRH